MKGQVLLVRSTLVSVDDYPELTDEELMVRVVDERAAFDCLIGRYEAKLRRYLRRLMPGLREDTDDLLQEVFVKVYMHARGFDPSLKFSSWIYRIAHNEAVSWLRKKKVRPETVDLGEDECATFVASAELARDKRELWLTRDVVARVLARMSSRYRTVLLLRFLEGRSYEEIGDILAVPGGTVATLIHRAKKEFGSVYKTHHGG